MTLEDEFLKIQKDKDVDLMHPLVWAYVGDAVFELYVRTMMILQGIAKVNELHLASVRYVKASAQADFLRNITAHLTEAELRIIKKGRNTKSTVPKNIEMEDYRYSTGLESLLGYLYLKDETGRLREILKLLEVEQG